MNVFTAVGRIGRDAETKYTQAGKPLTVWPLAVDDGFGDNKVTTWFDCVMFGERGTKLAEYIVKGGQLAVSGSIRLDTYTSKDGTDKSKIAMRIQEVTLLAKPNTERQTRPPEPKPQAAQAKAEAFADDFEDSDIPF